MTNPTITLYGAHWCPDCRRSKQFLGEHRIPYTWVDIEQDPTAEQFVIEKNHGKRIIPTSSLLMDHSWSSQTMPNWQLKLAYARQSNANISR